MKSSTSIVVAHALIRAAACLPIAEWPLTAGFQDKLLAAAACAFNAPAFSKQQKKDAFRREKGRSAPRAAALVAGPRRIHA
jgi:hypothetical protein